MDFDRGWEAVLKPGNGTQYFDVHAAQPFASQTIDYDPVNAWWLAELSRLIYKPETEETQDPAHEGRRKKALQQVSLREEHFITNPIGTQCALVVSETSGEGPGFAVLVFRGSQEREDWRTNSKFLLRPWNGPGRVHSGFRDAFEAVWEDVNRWLESVDGPVFYTGHSLGAALATLAASRRPPAALYTFGSPRVGDAEFTRTLDSTPAYRVVNHRDVVTRVPPPLLGFAHVGHLHYIAHDGRCCENAIDDVVATDRKRRSSADGNTPRHSRRLSGPPDYLSDHAPVNYVAHLERQVDLEY